MSSLTTFCWGYSKTNVHVHVVEFLHLYQKYCSIALYHIVRCTCTCIYMYVHVDSGNPPPSTIHPARQGPHHLLCRRRRRRSALSERREWIWLWRLQRHTKQTHTCIYTSITFRNMVIGEKFTNQKRARVGIKFLDHKYLQSSNNQRLHTLFKTYLLKSFEDIQCTEDVHVLKESP